MSRLASMPRAIHQGQQNRGAENPAPTTRTAAGYVRRNRPDTARPAPDAGLSGCLAGGHRLDRRAPTARPAAARPV